MESGQAALRAIALRGAADGLRAPSRPPEPSAIFHSDQGTEYVSNAVREVLAELGLKAGISHKGHCWDKAYMESFFHTLKTEMIHFERFATLEETIAHIINYLRFYNCQRIHSGIGYLTPHGMANAAAWPEVSNETG